MGAFITDRSLPDADLELLARAQRGDKQALRSVCQRFQTLLFALVLHHTEDWVRAAESVEPLLDQLCRELLAGQIVATDWSARAAQLAAEIRPAQAAASAAGSGLDGLGSIPRVVKRRALRQVLPQLPLAELMALLLRYLENRRPEEMVGLIADSTTDVVTLLVSAHDQTLTLLEALPAVQEITP